jgi:hypothetical protein
MGPSESSVQEGERSTSDLHYNTIVSAEGLKRGELHRRPDQIDERKQDQQQERSHQGSTPIQSTDRTSFAVKPVLSTPVESSSRKHSRHSSKSTESPIASDGYDDSKESRRDQLPSFLSSDEEPDVPIGSGQPNYDPSDDDSDNSYFDRPDGGERSLSRDLGILSRKSSIQIEEVPVGARSPAYSSDTESIYENQPPSEIIYGRDPIVPYRQFIISPQEEEEMGLDRGDSAYSVTPRIMVNEKKWRPRPLDIPLYTPSPEPSPTMTRDSPMTPSQSLERPVKNKPAAQRDMEPTSPEVENLTFLQRFLTPHHNTRDQSAITVGPLHEPEENTSPFSVESPRLEKAEQSQRSPRAELIPRTPDPHRNQPRRNFRSRHTPIKMPGLSSDHADRNKGKQELPSEVDHVSSPRSRVPRQRDRVPSEVDHVSSPRSRAARQRDRVPQDFLKSDSAFSDYRDPEEVWSENGDNQFIDR